MARATARCVFPTPGVPSNRRLAASDTKGMLASSLTWRLSTEGWKPKSNCSRVRWKGKWASRVRVVRYLSRRAAASMPNRSASTSGEDCVHALKVRFRGPSGISETDDPPSVTYYEVIETSLGETLGKECFWF